jgi:RPA family protein
MPEQEFQRRQIAYKASIKDVLDSKYVKNENFTPNYLELNSQEISRVNIVGVIVQKAELSNYKSLILDDGTGKISARVFENYASLNDFNVSDVVLVTGKPREFASEKYIVIETIKKINPAWAKVRNLELQEKQKGDNTQKKEVVEEKSVDLNPQNNILKLIKDLDKGNGVSIEDLPSEKFNEFDKIINAMLKEGDIFEVKPGRYKVLE